MKQKRLEALRRCQKQYHRKHPWRLSAGGLFIPHAYTDMNPDSLSSWDDVGFIQNGRRIIVWWRHPRHVFDSAIEDRAWEIVGEGPRDPWLTEGETKNYKTVGRSRKKLVSYTLRDPSAAQLAHYSQLNSTIASLREEGIDLTIPAAWSWNRLWWAMGVSLVAPVEVRNEHELAQVADLAKRLIRNETTLSKEFPGYRYGRQDWLSEMQATGLTDPAEMAHKRLKSQLL